MATWNLIPPAEWLETEAQVIEASNYLQHEGALDASTGLRKLGFDTETTGLHYTRDYPLILSLSDGVRRFAAEWEPWGRHPAIKDKLLENPRILNILTNAKFDMHMIGNRGVQLLGDVRCTLMMDWLFDENRWNHDLKTTAREHCGIKMLDFKEVFPMHKKKKGQPDDTAGAAIKRVMADPAGRIRAIEYAGLDAFASVKVHDFLEDKLKQDFLYGDYSYWQYFLDWEVEFTRTLFNMERRGFKLATGHLRAQIGPMEEDIEELNGQIAHLCGHPINPNSPKQLAKLFFEELGRKPIKYTKGGKTGIKSPSTDAEVMDRFAEDGCPYAQLIVDIRSLVKTKGTYIETPLELVDDNLRIHTQLKQHGTVTGRLSSKEPNLQNLPRPAGDAYRIREAFVAEPRKILLVRDYEQLEMRIMAHFCLHKQMFVSAPTEGKIIGEIVHRKWKGEVYSYDQKTGKKVVRKVVDHFRNGLPIDTAPYRGGLKPKDWVVIRHEGAPWRKLIITKEHNIYTPEGKKPVSELKVGDFIYHEEPHLAGNAEQVLIGSLLGDGNFKRAKSDTGDGYFHSAAFYHGIAQKDYFDFKLQILKPFVYSYAFDGRMHRGKVVASFQIEQLKSLMCEKRKGRKAKRPTVAIIDKITTAGLAIWYMDDGCLYKDTCCSETKGFAASIGNSRITQKEITFLNKKFKLNFKKWSRGMGLCGPDAEKFFSLIAAFIPPCMDYKIPLHHQGIYNSDYWESNIVDITPVRIIEKRLGDSKKDPMGFGSGSKYDITVEDTHNYFAQGILVSNSQDPRMIQAIRDGLDLHCYTVSLMYGEDYDEVAAAKKKSKDELTERDIHLLGLRQAAKATGFGLIYGIGAKKLGLGLGKELGREFGVKESKALIRRYFDIFTGVEAFIKDTHKSCKQNEFVRTLLGRKRRLPMINAGGGRRSRDGDDVNTSGIAAMAQRQSVNSIVQGSAADIAKAAMLKCEADQELKTLESEMLMQVHDELIFEVWDTPEHKALTDKRVKHLMENPFGDFQLSVPIPTSGSFAYTWADAK